MSRFDHKTGLTGGISSLNNPPLHRSFDPVVDLKKPTTGTLEKVASFQFQYSDQGAPSPKKPEIEVIDRSIQVDSHKGNQLKTKPVDPHLAQMGKTSAIVNILVNWPCMVVTLGLIILICLTYLTMWLGHLNID